MKAYTSSGANADPMGYGIVLKSIGELNQHFNKYTEALNFYQKAINQFYPAFTSANVYVNPEQYSGVFSYINLFNSLNAKAEAWHAIYLEKKDIKAGQEELNVYQ